MSSFNLETLDQFLTEYGQELGREAESALAPLHVPGRDGIDHLPELLRPPFEAQAHVAAATVKLWHRQRAVQLIAEMGTGKTFMAMLAIHTHAGQRVPKRWEKYAPVRAA